MPKVFALALISLMFTACKATDDLLGNEPIVDMQGVNIVAYEADLVDCQAYADQVQIGRQTAVGTVAGAAVGSVFGAIIGDSGTTQRGAGVGAVSGGVRGVSGGLSERERVIRRCLMGRGYRVLN